MTDEADEGPRGDLDELLAIIDHLPAMVAYWDQDSRNRVANRAYVEWFGVTPEHLRGMHIRELLGPELYEANLPFIEGALSGVAQQFQRTLVDTHGVTRYTQASYVPNLIDGVVRGFFVLVTDISERTRAEMALAVAGDRYRALVRSIPGGFVLLFDSQLRFLVADGDELDLFGYTHETLEGRTLHEAFPAQMAAELEPRYRSALAGVPVSWEREIGDRVFSLTAGPVRGADGGVSAGTVICTEITEQRRNEATAAALRDVARLVADHASLETVAASVSTHLRRLFALEQTSVFRFNPSGTVEMLASAEPLSDASVSLAVDPDGGGAVAAVFRTGRAATVRYGDPVPVTSGPDDDRVLRVGAAAPVRVQGRVWGAIAIASAAPDRIDQAMLARLESFADLVQLAVGNAEAWETLTQQAITDPVTGLPNRQWFNQSLANEVARAERHDRPLSLVVFDVDNFKRVNDTFGHPTGDRVLHELGRRLAAVARRSETVARVGGEEFAWILAETDAEDALSAAEHVRAAIAAEPFGAVGQVTVSAGVSSLDRSNTLEGLVANADSALYDAKHRGRNRAVLFTAGDSETGYLQREHCSSRGQQSSDLDGYRSWGRSTAMPGTAIVRRPVHRSRRGDRSLRGR